MTDHTRTLSLVLGLIRSGAAVTRPDLGRQTGLGRTIITQRVDHALRVGLVAEGEPAPSTGGRPSRILRIASGRGAVLGAVFGATHLHAAVTDLDGTLLADRRVPWDIESGPEASLATLVGTAERLLSPELGERLWGVCVGVPGPVDFARGMPVRPPIMAGWHGFPLRDRLEAHYDVPAWVDNDANLMALGAWSRTRATAGDNILLVKASTGIGLGLMSRGRLHRGARGAAGDLGHTIVAEESRHRCRCGKFGCLEAFAGGWALSRDARAAALEGRSPFLAERLERLERLERRDAPLSVTDVLDGCRSGDRVSIELVTRAGELVGGQLATLVSVFNPSTVYLAGVLAQAGDVFRDPVAEVVARRSLPLATDELVIARVDLGRAEGVVGAATLAIDELLHPDLLDRWLRDGSPRGIRARTGDLTGPLPLEVPLAGAR
ncbi:ROK family protein [Streptomyces sp900105755]|uniref:ROK family protein n=1 Tax=unclassified Streptomyces TaxID=2593676 RepID=UPI0008944FBC|nr:ROK family protein [Streptomyces sp. Ag109_O5-10]SEE42337.1 Sugar kinase of the NBD/HSP70 family, may contain an N-terminal HTH domain [Streptomyces sp. Ag109_O5-10]